MFSFQKPSYNDYQTVKIYPNEILFQKPERIIICGNSESGKTFLIENIVRCNHEKFHKIVISGSGNKLLTFPETKDKTILYKPSHQNLTTSVGENEIFNPFDQLDDLNVGNSSSKQILLLYDDLMESIFKSKVISKLFSTGRHYNLSTLLIIQSFFPKYRGLDLSMQIKINSTIQIFMHSAPREIEYIASRLEYSTKNKQFFIKLFNSAVASRRYGYLAVFLNSRDFRTRYRNNLYFEDGIPYMTVFAP